ncbi:alpha/beta hydrolase family protein [Caenimonas sedimenti]|nr:alpha/beta family hydrolase [Caenimonas sedimenti]
MKIAVSDGVEVSGVLDAPASPWACYVFAHGAGAGMRHTFMQSMAEGFAERGIACLRFQFPFMEQGSKRTDPPVVAQAAVRAAAAEAARRLPGVPLFAGGKSFGARMTSQAQAADALAGVRGLVFVGFPLHPAGKPGVERAKHLANVELPMLFLQGTRDELADLGLVRDTVATLGAWPTLHVVDAADHSFHVLVRSGRNDAQVREELLETAARWMKQLA